MQNLNEKLKEIVSLNEEMHSIKDDVLKSERKMAKRDKEVLDLREQLEETRNQLEEARKQVAPKSPVNYHHSVQVCIGNFGDSPSGSAKELL